MRKRTKNQAASGAKLWTPWGLQGHNERNARKVAIAKLLRRLAEIDRRKLLEAAKD